MFAAAIAATLCLIANLSCVDEALQLQGLITRGKYEGFRGAFRLQCHIAYCSMPCPTSDQKNGATAANIRLCDGSSWLSFKTRLSREAPSRLILNWF